MVYLAAPDFMGYIREQSRYHMLELGPQSYFAFKFNWFNEVCQKKNPNSLIFELSPKVFRFEQKWRELQIIQIC